MSLADRARSVFAQAPAGAHELAGIQYVRAIAAFMVLADHISRMMGGPSYYGRHPFGAVFETGTVGVDLFFCLSGFIIVYIAVDAAWAPTLGAWVFFKRRFARIVPFLWVVVVVSALGFLAKPHTTFPYLDYLRALVLWPFGLVAPSVVWTLPHEFLFYSVFALTFLSGRRWLLAVWALSPLALAAGRVLVGRQTGPGADVAWFLFNPIDLLFGAGVVLGLIYVRYRQVWRPAWWAAPATVAGCVVVYGLAMAMDYDRSVPWMVIVLGVASALSLAAACAVPEPRGVIGDLGRRFGDASYCIYLTQLSFVSVALGVLSRYGRGLPDEAVMVIAFLFTALGGLALHHLVERPIVAWSQRLLFPRRIEGR